MEPVKTGERLRCADCGTEVIIVKADKVRPACCGKPLAPPLPRGEAAAAQRQRPA